jgi:hypothetical protein
VTRKECNDEGANTHVYSPSTDPLLGVYSRCAEVSDGTLQARSETHADPSQDRALRSVF